MKKTYGDTIALGFDFKFTSNHNPKLTNTQKAAFILPRTTCQTTSSGLVAKLTTWQSGLEVRITVVFLSAYH